MSNGKKGGVTGVLLPLPIAEVDSVRNTALSD